MNAGVSPFDTNSSPWAFGSGELKKTRIKYDKQDQQDKATFTERNKNKEATFAGRSPHNKSVDFCLFVSFYAFSQQSGSFLTIVPGELNQY
jgi:hypothetical protein